MFAALLGSRQFDQFDIQNKRTKYTYIKQDIIVIDKVKIHNPPT
jgi:hypothetical protein